MQKGHRTRGWEASDGKEQQDWRPQEAVRLDDAKDGILIGELEDGSDLHRQVSLPHSIPLLDCKENLMAIINMVPGAAPLQLPPRRSL